MCLFYSTLQCYEQKNGHYNALNKKKTCFPKIDMFMTILFIATNEINIDNHSHFLLQMIKKVFVLLVNLIFFLNKNIINTCSFRLLKENRPLFCSIEKLHSVTLPPSSPFPLPPFPPL